MKTVTLTRQIDVFQCEICGKTDPTRRGMEDHEKSHKQSTCTHDQRWYRVDVDTDRDGMTDIRIVMTCRLCTLSASVLLAEYGDAEVLDKVFKILGGEEEILKAVKKDVVSIDKEAEFLKLTGRPMTEIEKAVFL